MAYCFIFDCLDLDLFNRHLVHSALPGQAHLEFTIMKFCHILLNMTIFDDLLFDYRLKRKINGVRKSKDIFPMLYRLS